MTQGQACMLLLIACVITAWLWHLAMDVRDKPASWIEKTMYVLTLIALGGPAVSFVFIKAVLG